MRILIMGVGGLGGVFSAELLRHGENPTLLTYNGVITQAINRNGLLLSTPQEEGVSVPARAMTTAAELPPGARYDAVWLLMKATAVLDAVRVAHPLLADDGYMVAFQNGLVEEAILHELGDTAHLLTASVAFGGTMEAPGVYRRTTDGTIFVGELDGKVTERVRVLRGLLAHIVPTQVSTNIRGLLWGKLCWNATVSGLCAVAGGTFGRMAATEQGRDLLLRGYTEVIDTAHAHGIDVVPEVVGPTLALHTPPDVDEAGRAARHQLLLDMCETFGAVKPSSLQSLERGRPTETAFLNGYVVTKAAEAGLSVPLNAALVRMIAEIERGERDIHPANLRDLMQL